ncbi:hypothetical protein AN641_02900 [Candidatus Epulonipiscioides gigas]|nr:hypothetical protein AN641_02900 [Epulopiscium sp. SCG-C07WGA-EpuloA2]
MDDKYITSVSNSIIKNIKELQTKKQTRQKEELFVVEGTRAVNDIKNIADILYFVATENIPKENFTKQIQWITVSENVFSYISETKTPQGIMAIVKQKCKSLSELTVKKGGTYLVLENITDPGNLGTIIRTAYGLFVDAIFLTKGCAELYSPKVVRSTMSSILKIDIIKNYDISDYITFFKKNNIKIYATDLQQSTNLYNTNFDSSVALIIGNEANGVSEYTRENSDEFIKIPIQNGLESLNAAIATSIILYEISKQK